MKKNILPWLFFGMLFTFTLYVSVLLFYPYKTVVIERPLDIKLENTVLRHGEDVVMNMTYCKYINEGCVVTKTFVNGIIYATPPQEFRNVPPGCKAGVLNHMITIPPELPEGKYKLQVTFEYELNPLRKETVRLVTEEFTVTK